MKRVIITQWVRARKRSSPTRLKASHRVGSQTKVRSLKGGVRSSGKASTQARKLNSENCIMVDTRISPGNRTQSRWGAAPRRQQSGPRAGQRAGPHRGLRAGHECRGVIRELGRASRLLGNKRRNKGDRHDQHPGGDEAARFAPEPPSARAERDTNQYETTQGTGREPQANRPGRTKAVVAAHSTARQGNPCPEAWGTEAQGTHDKSRLAAGRQSQVGRSCLGKTGGTLSPLTVSTPGARTAI